MPNSLLPLPKPFETTPLKNTGYGDSGASGPTINGRVVVVEVAVDDDMMMMKLRSAKLSDKEKKQICSVFLSSNAFHTLLHIPLTRYNQLPGYSVVAN
jgi:hypothetical protein